MLVTQSCLTVCYLMDCSPPGSSVHKIFRTRILMWLPFPSAGDLLNLGIQPASPASAGGFFITEPPGMPGYPGSIPSWGTKISQVVVLSASPGCTVRVRVRVRVCVCMCVSGALWNADEQHTRASASQNKWFWGTATSHRDPYLVFTRMLFLGLAGILS